MRYNEPVWSVSERYDPGAHLSRREGFSLPGKIKSIVLLTELLAESASAMRFQDSEEKTLQ